MKIGQVIRISLHNLLSKKSRTLFTISAIAVSFAAILILLSLGYGLQRLVEQQTVGLEALRLIDVDAENSSIVSLNSESVNRIKSIAGVENVIPQISAAGKLHIDGSIIDATVFLTEGDYLELSYKSTLWGNTDDALGERSLFLNDVVPGLLSIEASEQIIDREVGIDLVFSPSVLEINEDSQTTYSGLLRTVQGVVVDRKVENRVPIVYLSINQFPDLYSNANFSRVKVLLNDPESLESVRAQIENLGYRTSSAADTVEQIDSVFTTFRIVLFVIGLVGVTIAILGMFNTLTISLMDRMREIGIMKALGMQGKYVLGLFLTESVMISISGGIAGLIISVLGGNILEKTMQFAAEVQDRPSVDFYYTPLSIAGLMLLFSALTGLITGIYPAVKAMRMKPLDALRYE